MNKYAQMTAIMALVTGLALANTSIPQSYAFSSSEEKAYFGHFTLVVTDQFGNIKDYRELDNTITDEGDACIATQAFSATGAACTGGVIESIAVSNCDGAGTSTGQGNNDCGTINDATTTFDDTEDANVGDECDTTGESGYTAPAYTTAPNKVRISSQFTFSPLEVDSDGLVKEAGILAGCGATDALFAIKDFATITLTGSDTLTVNYDVSFTG